MSADRKVVQLHNDSGMVAAYPATPQVALEFWPDVTVFTLDAGDGAFLSYDGVNDHIELSAERSQLTLPLRYTKIWLRAVGEINPTTVSVFASNHAH